MASLWENRSPPNKRWGNFYRLTLDAIAFAIALMLAMCAPGWRLNITVLLAVSAKGLGPA